MLRTLSTDDALRLSDYFRTAEYTREGLRRTLIANELTSVRLRNLPQLLYKTGAATSHNVLLRWFAIGVAVETRIAREVIPRDVLDILLQCGLLESSGDSLVPYAMLNPFEDMLIAADHSLKIESGLEPNVVLGLNATTWLLYRFAIPAASRRTLDLGCGSGALALAAARHSETVVATDINPAAIDFMTFNAALNRMSPRIEPRLGDRFVPVKGEKFDLITANPPFFITPSSRQLFCENEIELDGFCRNLVAQGPQHLEDGGYFQMTFEWVEVENEPWRDRLSGWLDKAGCDAIVYKSYSQDPSRYALERIRDGVERTPQEHADLFSSWMRYYEANGVQAIHGGLLAMRRRPGKNWIQFGELPVMPSDRFGGSVAAAFQAQDTLERYRGDRDLLEGIPLLSPTVRLEQEFQQVAGAWERLSLKLSLDQPLHTSQRLEPDVAGFLNRFDGQHSLREIVNDIASNVGATRDQVERECLTATRQLIERGFVIVCNQPA